MKTLSPDTDLKTESVWIDLIRRQPTWKKIREAGRMYEMGLILARAGLRRRLPDIDEAERKRRLAEHWLGPDLARRIAARVPR